VSLLSPISLRRRQTRDDSSLLILAAAGVFVQIGEQLQGEFMLTSSPQSIAYTTYFTFVPNICFAQNRNKYDYWEYDVQYEFD
jgi:hypothetical protein